MYLYHVSITLTPHPIPAPGRALRRCHGQLPAALGAAAGRGAQAAKPVVAPVKFMVISWENTGNLLDTMNLIWIRWI